MEFISDILGFRIGSQNNTENENSKTDGGKVNENLDDDTLGVLSDIAKIARAKLSWFMFKARHFQRRTQSQPGRHERRRRMYDTVPSGSCVSDNKTRTYGVSSQLSENVTLDNTPRFNSRLHGTNADLPDDAMTNTSAYLRESSIFHDIIVATNGLQKRLDKSRRDGNLRAHCNRCVTDVESRVATELAARRQEIAGMTSSQRVTYFRKKYGLENGN